MQTRGGNPALPALHRIVPSEDLPEFLTTEQAASSLGLSYWTLVSWRRPGNTTAPADLPWFYDRGRVRYRRADVLAFLSRNAREIAA